MKKQAVIGAGFAGLDLCPSHAEIGLLILGQHAVGDEPVEIIKISDQIARIPHQPHIVLSLLDGVHHPPQKGAFKK